MLNWNDDREIIFFLGNNHYFRLRWNPSDYGDIDHIYINRGEIWCPEITVVAAYAFINMHINSGVCPNLTPNLDFNFTTFHLSLQISGERLRQSVTHEMDPLDCRRYDRSPGCMVFVRQQTQHAILREESWYTIS